MFRALAEAWGRRIGERVAKDAIDDFVKSDSFAEMIQDVSTKVLKRPEFAYLWFIKHMQARMMEVDKNLTGKRAFELAAAAYREFLKDEKTQFGDPRFDWTRDGARDLIQAYEIDHWESAP